MRAHCCVDPSDLTKRLLTHSLAQSVRPICRYRAVRAAKKSHFCVQLPIPAQVFDSPDMNCKFFVEKKANKNDSDFLPSQR